jgi:hypothetical protein
MDEATPMFRSRPKWALPVAVIAIVFGIATILSGGKSLFTDAGRVAAGSYVPFVLWFNFLAGFAYILAGVGLIQVRKWARRFVIFIAAATGLVFGLFLFQVFRGQAYEMRTVYAMILRFGFWLVVAVLCAGRK